MHMGSRRGDVGQTHVSPLWICHWRMGTVSTTTSSACHHQSSDSSSSSTDTHHSVTNDTRHAQ